MTRSSDDPDNVIDDVTDDDEVAVAAAGGVIPSEEGISLCQQLYIDSGNEKKALFLMSIGLMNHNNEPLFSFEREPWSLLPKTFLRPRSTEYVNEIVRRAALFGIMPVPRPNNWTRVQTMDWLERNPIRDVSDVDFLTNEVLRLQDLFVRRAQEQEDLNHRLVGGNTSTSGGTNGGRAHWRGCIPYLRTIMCLTQDNVKYLFLTRADSRSRQQLDARNSNIRPPTVFEVIAELWNSSAFNPIATASECHFDFQLATDCSYALVAGLTPATPQRIEDCFTSMRSDLLRIITRWEQSGQGEGGRDQEDEEDDAVVDENALNADDDASCVSSSIATTDEDASPRRRSANVGCLSGRPVRALQSRAAFLNGRPSYLLYFWEVADAHQLLQSSLQRLSNNTGAMDASCAPSATITSSSGSRGRQRRRQQTGADAGHDDEQGVLASLAQSMKELSDCQRQMQHARAEDRVHERQLEDQRLLSEGIQETRKRVFERRTKLLDEARKYRKLNAELVMGDERSQRLSEFYENELRLLEDEIRGLESD